MQHDLIAAAVQMTSGEDKAVNRATAERLLRRASAAGAELVVLPEYFNCLGDRRAMLAQAEPLPGPTSTWLAALAAELRITLVGGTVGSGKSSAAREIADALDAVLLASDALRKRLAGMAATDRSAASRGLYTAAAKHAVYRALLERAAPVLRAASSSSGPTCNSVEEMSLSP